MTSISERISTHLTYSLPLTAPRHFTLMKMYLGTCARAVFEMNPFTVHTVFCFCHLFLIFASFMAFAQEGFQARENSKYVFGAWASFAVSAFVLLVSAVYLNILSSPLEAPSPESTEEQPIHHSHKTLVFGALFAFGSAIAEIEFALLFANSPNRPLATTIACGMASLTAYARIAGIATAITDCSYIYHNSDHPLSIISMGRLQYQRVKLSDSEGE